MLQSEERREENGLRSHHWLEQFKGKRGRCQHCGKAVAPTVSNLRTAKTPQVSAGLFAALTKVLLGRRV